MLSGFDMAHPAQHGPLISQESSSIHNLERPALTGMQHSIFHRTAENLTLIAHGYAFVGQKWKKLAKSTPCNSATVYGTRFAGASWALTISEIAERLNHV